MLIYGIVSLEEHNHVDTNFFRNFGITGTAGYL
jgi:hypothetical protein